MAALVASFCVSILLAGASLAQAGGSDGPRVNTTSGLVLGTQNNTREE